LIHLPILKYKHSLIFIHSLGLDHEFEFEFVWGRR
jgi:hypothetical protein